MTHKLNYWVAECLTDSRVYSIRARTKRDCLAGLAKAGCGPDGEPVGDQQYRNRYTSPHKVTVEYDDAFDLMFQCLSNEGGLYEANNTDDGK